METTNRIEPKQFVHTSSYRTGWVLAVHGDKATVDFGFSPSTGRKNIEIVSVDELHHGMGGAR